MIRGVLLAVVAALLLGSTATAQPVTGRVTPAEVNGFTPSAAAAAPVQSVNGLLGAVTLALPIYASGCTPTGPCTVATALASTCDSSTVGTLARVNNLFSTSATTNTTLTCTTSGSLFFWRPNVTDLASSLPCSGTVNLTPYSTPPTMLCQAATLGATLNFNVQTTPQPWCGETWNISTQSLVPVLNTVNLIGALTKLLGIGGYQVVYVCPAAGSGSFQVFP